MAWPWTETETQALAEAWAEVIAASKAHPQSSADLNDALYRSFLRIARASPTHRSRGGVLTKRDGLRALFGHIYEFNEAQADSGESSWFDLPLDRRKKLRATWASSHMNGELSLAVYNMLLPILAPEEDRTLSPSRSGEAASSASTGGAVSSFEPWKYPELMILARASAETRRAHPSHKIGFDEASMSPLLAKYREYGGSRSRTKRAVANQARYLLEAYRFISSFNREARRAGEQGWFHLSSDERLVNERQFDGSTRLLRHMDKKMFVVMKASRSPKQQKRIKREATEIHQVTESRRYRVSSGQAVVSVNEKRRIRSGRYIDNTTTATLATRRDAASESPHEVARLLQRHLGGENRVNVELEDEEDDGEVTITEIRPVTRQTNAMVASQAGQSDLASALEHAVTTATRQTGAVVVASQTGQSDYTSALEHAVTTMSAQLAELDRRLTEARINENKRMLVRILRACRQSSGVVPATLVQDMLKRAGSNMLQIVDLSNQQQEQDEELMQRLMSALTNGDTDSA